MARTRHLHAALSYFVPWRDWATSYRQASQRVGPYDLSELSDRMSADWNLYTQPARIATLGRPRGFVMLELAILCCRIVRLSRTP